LRLRRLVEEAGVAGLAELVERAWVLADALCWEAIQRGDLAAFAIRAETGAALREYGACSGLIGAW
jgi:hypothetical protein